MVCGIGYCNHKAFGSKWTGDKSVVDLLGISLGDIEYIYQFWYFFNYHVFKGLIIYFIHPQRYPEYSKVVI